MKESWELRRLTENFENDARVAPRDKPVGCESWVLLFLLFRDRKLPPGEAEGRDSACGLCTGTKECHFHDKAVPYLRHRLQGINEMMYVKGIWKLKSTLQISEITIPKRVQLPNALGAADSTVFMPPQPARRFRTISKGRHLSEAKHQLRGTLLILLWGITTWTNSIPCI